MGFQEPVYKLVWGEGSRWHGLEVKLRGLSIGEMKLLDSMQDKLSNMQGFAGAEPVLDLLAKSLISWNVTSHDGIPVPVSAPLDERDGGMIMAIVGAWQEAVADVPAPLPQTSTDGKPSAEEPITMETLSASLLSSTTQN